METRHAGIPVAPKVSSVKGDGTYDGESTKGGRGGSLGIHQRLSCSFMEFKCLFSLKHGKGPRTKNKFNDEKIRATR